jgi:hypothetical protein
VCKSKTKTKSAKLDVAVFCAVDAVAEKMKLFSLCDHKSLVEKSQHLDGKI